MKNYQEQLLSYNEIEEISKRITPSKRKTIAKYGSTSIAATVVDLTIFRTTQIFILWFARHEVILASVLATLMGRFSGAFVAFFMQKRWVFKEKAASRRTIAQLWRFGIGFVIGTVLNIVGVWFLVSAFNIDGFYARIVVATLVWAFIFWFNKSKVF